MPDLFTFPNPEIMPSPRRVVLHWSAGKYISWSGERNDYHALIEWHEGNPRVIKGVPIVNNLHELTSESPTYALDKINGYAPHTHGFNSWSMGIAICAMWRALDRDNLGLWPVLSEQVDALITLCAQTAVVFGMEVGESTFFTHYEAHTLHGVPQNRQRDMEFPSSKWDITIIPQAGDLLADEVGPWLREQIAGRL